MYEMTAEEYIEMYNQKKYKKYITCSDEYQLMIDTSVAKTYVSNINGLKTISVKNMHIGSDMFISIYYKYDGKYHRDDGPAFIRIKNNLELLSLGWFKNGNKYNENGPSKIVFNEYDGNVCYMSWTNKNGDISNYNGPACVQICETNKLYVRNSYYINGEYYSKKQYETFINRIKNGSIEKNINRYYYVKKLNAIRDTAKFYGINSLVEKVDDIILVSKLKGILM